MNKDYQVTTKEGYNVLKYKDIIFDDFTDGEYNLWSQVCESCRHKHNFPDEMLDEVGGGICGVEGCNNEADYYIDFV